jgi:hypothetical protein
MMFSINFFFGVHEYEVVKKYMLKKMIIIEIEILPNQRTYNFKFNAKYDWFNHVTN